MGAQGLLDHRRAGTGKADDEDRLGDVGADAGARQDLEPRRDEEGLEAPHQRRGLLRQIGLAGQRAQAALGLAEGGEGLGVAAHPVEQQPLFAPLDRPETAALAPPLDVVERGQRLVVGLHPPVQDRAVQDDARVSGREFLRRVESSPARAKLRSVSSIRAQP